MRQELDRRKCTIPQAWVNKKSHNVVKGEFIRAGQMNWAVLCSVRRVSSILVFGDSSASNPTELAREADIHKLQDVGKGELGYSREIAPAGRAFVLSHNRKGAGAIDHDGINDAFVEKASVVLLPVREVDTTDASGLIGQCYMGRTSLWH